MAHVNCPKCGQRLELPAIQETRGVRCPACKHEFAVSPPSQPQPPLGDYTGESGSTGEVIGGFVFYVTWAEIC